LLAGDAVERQLHSIILAGGLGTRLRDAVPDVPKPMAPIRGRPFLEHLLLQLRGQGYRDVVLCVGHGAEVIRGYFGDGVAFGVRLSYSVESEPLGTAGALRLAAQSLAGERWLMLNGDSCFGIPFEQLVAAHDRTGAIATIALRRTMEPERFGTVALDGDGQVTSFVEKAAGMTGSRLMNAGLYVIDRSLIELIPAGRAASLEREVLPGLVGRGLYGAEFEAPFVDIGVPDDYFKLRDEPDLVLGELPGEV
jgi:NDP-sugar pyrophosphorylase family protein